MRRFSKPGNTLSEYAIIIGLLSVLGVGGLSLLGNSVSDLLSSASSGSGLHSMQGYLNSTLETGSVSAQNGGSPGNTAPLQRAVAVPTGNPNTINVPANSLVGDATGGGTNATSVDGVDMLKEHADRLTSLVREIQADPDHDPALLDLVTKLANTGHTAGESIATGEQQYFNAPAVASLDSVVTPTPSSITMNSALQANSDFQQTMGYLNAYLTAHPNLLTTEQIAVVQSASKDITGVLDTLKQKGWNAFAAHYEQASVRVHGDSNNICKNGGNQQVCVK